MSVSESIHASNHPLYEEWQRIWRHVIGAQKIQSTAPDKLILSEKILNFPGGSPVLVAIDSSFDGARVSYAALVLAYGEMPRIMYKTGTGVSRYEEVERWGVKNVIRKIRRRYAETPPIVVFTDNLRMVHNPKRKLVRDGLIEFRWMSRETELIKALDESAKALRRSQPIPPKTGWRIPIFMNNLRLERGHKNTI